MPVCSGEQGCWEGAVDGVLFGAQFGGLQKRPKDKAGAGLLAQRRDTSFSPSALGGFSRPRLLSVHTQLLQGLHVGHSLGP